MTPQTVKNRQLKTGKTSSWGPGVLDFSLTEHFNKENHFTFTD